MTTFAELVAQYKAIVQVPEVRQGCRASVSLA